MFTTSLGPPSSAVTSWAYTVFTEFTVAPYRSTVPAELSPAFVGVHSPSGPAHIGSSIVIVDGPCQYWPRSANSSSSAAASVKGLNADPDCRPQPSHGSVARLSFDSSQSRPPTIASTSPVALSIVTSAASGLNSVSGRFSSTAASAMRCSFRSSVDVICRPPP